MDNLYVEFLGYVKCNKITDFVQTIANAVCQFWDSRLHFQVCEISLFRTNLLFVFIKLQNVV